MTTRLQEEIVTAWNLFLIKQIKISMLSSHCWGEKRSKKKQNYSFKMSGGLTWRLRGESLTQRHSLPKVCETNYCFTFEPFPSHFSFNFTPKQRSLSLSTVLKNLNTHFTPTLFLLDTTTRSCVIKCIDPGLTRTLKSIGFPPTAFISHKRLQYSILGGFFFVNV